MIETRDKFIFGNYMFLEMFEYFVFSSLFSLFFGFEEIENLWNVFVQCIYSRINEK